MQVMTFRSAMHESGSSICTLLTLMHCYISTLLLSSATVLSVITIGPAAASLVLVTESFRVTVGNPAGAVVHNHCALR